MESEPILLSMLDPDKHCLPDPGTSVMIALRFGNRELAACVELNASDECWAETMKNLRHLINTGNVRQD